MIYVTADSHFNHINIAGPSVSSWTRGYRHFQSVDDMNQTVLDSINSTVQEDDTLWHLGDFAMGGDVHNQIVHFRKAIKCRNVHLLYGNHDRKIEKSHDLQQLFSSVGHYTQFYFRNTLFCLQHFPLDVWDKHATGAIHLHGHCHGSLKQVDRKRFDVGWDVYYKPVPLELLLDKAEFYGIEIKDHHDN